MRASESATGVAENSSRVVGPGKGSTNTSTAPSSCRYVCVADWPPDRAPATSARAAASNSAHPRVPAREPSGPRSIFWPTRQGGSSWTPTAVASTTGSPAARRRTSSSSTLPAWGSADGPREARAGVVRFPAVAVAAAVAGVTGQQVEHVRNERQDRRQALDGPPFAPGEVDHQRRADRAGDAAGDRGERGAGTSGRPHLLGETGCLAFDDRPGRLGGHVPRPEARAAGRGHQAHGLPRQAAEQGFDLGPLVGDDLAPDDVEARPLQERDQRAARGVVPDAVGHAVAHRHHGRARPDRLLLRPIDIGGVRHPAILPAAVRGPWARPPGSRVNGGASPAVSWRDRSGGGA